MRATVSFYLETSLLNFTNIYNYVKAIKDCEYCGMYDIISSKEFNIMDKDETGKDKEYHIIMIDIDCESG